MTSHHVHDEIHGEMAFEDKIIKLLTHWKRHNDDHAGTYEKWAERAREKGLDLVARKIFSAAEKTTLINRELKEALKVLKAALALSPEESRREMLKQMEGRIVNPRIEPNPVPSSPAPAATLLKAKE